MSETVIEINNIGKQYFLGAIGTDTLSQALNHWWANIRGKEDPHLKMGETNDRTQTRIKKMTISTPSNGMIKNRDESLDYVKGILIFLVFYGHCLFWMGDNVTKTYIFIGQFIYSFHMPLFIFLSGYFFSSSKKKNIYETFFSKFKRLLVPHIFFNLIMILPIILFREQYGHWVTRESNGTITIKSIYLYITMFWYLWCVFLSSIICNIIYKTIHRHPGLFCLMTALLFYLVSAIFPSIKPFFIHQRMGDMFLYFVIGIFTYDYKNLINPKITSNITSISILFYFTYLYFLYKTKNGLPSHVIEIGQLSGLIAMYSFIKHLHNIKFGRKIFLFFSKWTLGIYIYHFVFLYGLMDWYNNTLKNFGNHLFFCDFVLAIITTILSALLSSSINKKKFLKKYALGN